MAGGSRKAVSLGGKARIATLPPGTEDATPERLRHAVLHGSAGIEAGTRRLADPFETLAVRGSLDHASRTNNDVLRDAGLRFRRHWYGSRLDSLKAFDFSRPAVDGGPGPQGATTPTEAALRHRATYRQAADAVGERLLPYLTGMVIESHPAAALCTLVSDTGHARTAEALVVERLREALHRLVQHWGLVGGRAPSRSVRPDHLARVQDI